MPRGKRKDAPAIPPDYTWPGFDSLPEPLRRCHREFFQALAHRRVLTLREYRRAFRALYDFMQEMGIGELAALTPQHLEAFQQRAYRLHHWTPGNMQGLLLTLARIGNFLNRLGLLKANPFARISLAMPESQHQGSTQPLTWFRAVRRFLTWVKGREVEPERLRTYLHTFRRFRQFLSKEELVPPSQISAEHIDRFAAFLTSHPVKKQRPLTPLMQRITVRRIRWFLQWLAREGMVPVEIPDRRHHVGRKEKIRPADPTSRLDTVIREFLAYVEMRYAPETRVQYTRSLKRFQEWIEARPKGERVINIDQATVELVTDYQRWLNAEATHADGALLRQPEKEARLYPLKAFLGFCHRKGFLKDDLRRFILVPGREHRVPKELLTGEQMVTLLEAPGETTTSGIRDRAMMEVAYSGLRATELLSLRVEDVDLMENRIFIREGKGDKERMVPMTSVARYWVDRWKRRRKEFVPREDSDRLFVSRRGRPITRRDFGRMLEHYGRQAQLPVKVSPHDLRRITATHLAANGAPMRYIQALLGHDTLRVTTKYLRLTHVQIKAEYKRTHPSNRRVRHAAAAG